MKKEKVGGYLRVSTTEQANDGFGLDDQKKKITQYCDVKDYDLVEMYCDAGVSGKDTKHRKYFNKMMADMKAKKFDRIVTLKIDRISRSVADFALLLQDLEENNCKIDFINEPIDVSGISGKMMAGILSVFAQFERELIVDRTTSGMREAAEQGHFGGKPPLGYTKEIINGEKGKKWVIHNEEAEVVKEIFNLCAKGKTYNDIANIIQEKYSDMVAYVRKDKETGEIKTIYRSWTDASISVILNNKTYLGIREHRKNVKGKETITIANQIEPIISKELFDECQLNIQRNKRNYYRNKKYLFMQKLVCPKCGRIMACNGTKKKTGQQYLYYKCKDCKVNFREDWVEEALMHELILVLELYLILEKNYVPIDSETAKDLVKGKIDNTIRYSLDTIMIEKKLDINYTYLDKIWETISYETKSDFIFEYIDTIKIKKHTRNGEPYVEILDLTFRPHMVKKFEEMFENNMMDLVLDNSEHEVSATEFTSKKQADDYINVLKKKYDINVYDKDEYVFSEDLFKIIDIKSKNVVEKDTTLFLEIAR